MDMRAENGGGGSAKQPVCQEPKRSNRKPKGGVTVTPEVERKVLLIFPDQDSVINALDSMMTSRNDGSGLLRDEKSQLDIKLKCLRESQHYQESSDSELKQMWFLATQRYKENPEVKAKLEAYEDTLKNERDALLSSEFLQHFPPNLFMRMLKEMTDTRGDIGAVGFEQQIGDWQKTVQVRAFRTEQTFACMHEQQLHKLWNGAYNYYKTHPTATEIENQKIVDFEKMIEAETALSPILKWRILLPETEVEIQRLQAMVEKATTLKQDAFSDHESGEQIEIHNIAYLQTCKASDRNSKRIEEHREKLASHTAQKLVLEKKYMCILDGHYSLALRGAGLYASLQEQFESIDGQQGESGFVKKEAVLEDHGWANFEDFEFLHALHESWKIKHQAQPHQDHGLDEPLKLALDFNSAHGCWKPDDALEKLSIGGILFVQITSGKMKTGCAVCVPRSNPHDTRTRITDIVAFSGDFKDCFPFGDIWSFKQNAENSKLASIKIKLRPGVKVEIETVQNQPAAFVSVSQTALQGVHHHILSQMQNCVELCLRMMEPESNQTCRRCAMPWRFLGKQCSQCSQKIPPRLKQKLSDYLSHVKLTTKSLNDSIEKCPFFLSCLNFDAAIDRMLKIMAASGILHFDEGLSEINWNASCNPQIFECFLRNMERSVLSDYESMICDSFLQLCSGQNFIWPTLPPRKSDNVSKFFEEARWPDFLQKVYFKMIEISNVPLQQNGCAHVELGGSEANAGVVDTSSSQARTTCLSTDSELRELGTRLQQFFDVDKKNDQACPIELAYLFCCFACGFVSEDGFVFLDIDAFNYDLLRERTMRALKQKQESHRCLHYDCKARNELERSKVIQSQAQRFSSPGDTAPENKTMKKIPVFQFKSQEPLQIWHEFVQISLDQAKPNIRSHKLWRRARFVLTETDESTSPLCVSITFLPSELLSERISSTKCYATVVRCNSAHTTSEHQRKYSVEAVKIDYVGERFQVIAKVEHIMMVIEDESAVHRLDIFTDKNEKLDSFFIEFHDRPLNMLKSSSLGHFPGLFAYNCLHENDVKISVKFRAEIQRHTGISFSNQRIFGFRWINKPNKFAWMQPNIQWSYTSDVFRPAPGSTFFVSDSSCIDSLLMQHPTESMNDNIFKAFLRIDHEFLDYCHAVALHFFPPDAPDLTAKSYLTISRDFAVLPESLDRYANAFADTKKSSDILSFPTRCGKRIIFCLLAKLVVNLSNDDEGRQILMQETQILDFTLTEPCYQNENEIRVVLESTKDIQHFAIAGCGISIFDLKSESFENFIFGIIDRIENKRIHVNIKKEKTSGSTFQHANSEYRVLTHPLYMFAQRILATKIPSNEFLQKMLRRERMICFPIMFSGDKFREKKFQLAQLGNPLQAITAAYLILLQTQKGDPDDSQMVPWMEEEYGSWMQWVMIDTSANNSVIKASPIHKLVLSIYPDLKQSIKNIPRWYISWVRLYIARNKKSHEDKFRILESFATVCDVHIPNFHDFFQSEQFLRLEKSILDSAADLQKEKMKHILDFLKDQQEEEIKNRTTFWLRNAIKEFKLNMDKNSALLLLPNMNPNLDSTHVNLTDVYSAIRQTLVNINSDTAKKRICIHQTLLSNDLPLFYMMEYDRMAKWLTQLRGSQQCVLYGPHRCGKSHLLESCFDQISQSKTKTMCVLWYLIGDQQQFDSVSTSTDELLMMLMFQYLEAWLRNMKTSELQNDHKCLTDLRQEIEFDFRSAMKVEPGQISRCKEAFRAFAKASLSNFDGDDRKVYVVIDNAKYCHIHVKAIEKMHEELLHIFGDRLVLVTCYSHDPFEQPVFDFDVFNCLKFPDPTNKCFVPFLRQLCFQFAIESGRGCFEAEVYEDIAHFALREFLKDFRSSSDSFCYPDLREVSGHIGAVVRGARDFRIRPLAHEPSMVSAPVSGDENGLRMQSTSSMATADSKSMFRESIRDIFEFRKSANATGYLHEARIIIDDDAYGGDGGLKNFIFFVFFSRKNRFSIKHLKPIFDVDEVDNPSQRRLFSMLCVFQKNTGHILFNKKLLSQLEEQYRPRNETDPTIQELAKTFIHQRFLCLDAPVCVNFLENFIADSNQPGAYSFDCALEMFKELLVSKFQNRCHDYYFLSLVNSMCSYAIMSDFWSEVSVAQFQDFSQCRLFCACECGSFFQVFFEIIKDFSAKFILPAHADKVRSSTFAYQVVSFLLFVESVYLAQRNGVQTTFGYIFAQEPSEPILTDPKYLRIVSHVLSQLDHVEIPYYGDCSQQSNLFPRRAITLSALLHKMKIYSKISQPAPLNRIAFRFYEMIERLRPDFFLKAQSSNLTSRVTSVNLHSTWYNTVLDVMMWVPVWRAKVLRQQRKLTQYEYTFDEVHQVFDKLGESADRFSFPPVAKLLHTLRDHGLFQYWFGKMESRFSSIPEGDKKQQHDAQEARTLILGLWLCICDRDEDVSRVLEKFRLLPNPASGSGDETLPPLHFVWSFGKWLGSVDVARKGKAEYSKILELIDRFRIPKHQAIAQYIVEFEEITHTPSDALNYLLSRSSDADALNTASIWNKVLKRFKKAPTCIAAPPLHMFRLDDDSCNVLDARKLHLEQCTLFSWTVKDAVDILVSRKKQTEGSLCLVQVDGVAISFAKVNVDQLRALGDGFETCSSTMNVSNGKIECTFPDVQMAVDCFLRWQSTSRPLVIELELNSRKQSIKFNVARPLKLFVPPSKDEKLEALFRNMTEVKCVPAEFQNKRSLSWFLGNEVDQPPFQINDIVKENVRNNIAAWLPCQAYVIPAILMGADVLVSSSAGSGKTIAYLAPLIALVVRRLENPSLEKRMFSRKCSFPNCSASSCQFLWCKNEDSHTFCTQHASANGQCPHCLNLRPRESAPLLQFPKFCAGDFFSKVIISKPKSNFGGIRTLEARCCGVSAIILVPSYDLVHQVVSTARMLLRGLDVRVYGTPEIRVDPGSNGSAPRKQSDRDNRANIADLGCDILVTIPSACRDLLTQGVLSLISCRFLCIDETDVIFREDPYMFQFVFDAWSSLVDDRNRQVLLFTSNLNAETSEWANQLNPIRKPLLFEFSETSEAFRREEFIDYIEEADKEFELLRILSNCIRDHKRMIVFVNGEKRAQKVYHLICQELHPDMQKNVFNYTEYSKKRHRTKEEIEKNTKMVTDFSMLVDTGILICQSSKGSLTGRNFDNLLGRHVDIVVLYDPVANLKVYTTIVGRIGRAGQEGRSFYFLQRNKRVDDNDLARYIETRKPSFSAVSNSQSLAQKINTKFFVDVDGLLLCLKHMLKLGIAPDEFSWHTVLSGLQLNRSLKFFWQSRIYLRHSFVVGICVLMLKSACQHCALRVVNSLFREVFCTDTAPIEKLNLTNYDIPRAPADSVEANPVDDDDGDDNDDGSDDDDDYAAAAAAPAAAADDDDDDDNSIEAKSQGTAGDTEFGGSQIRISERSEYYLNKIKLNSQLVIVLLKSLLYFMGRSDNDIDCMVTDLCRNCDMCDAFKFQSKTEPYCVLFEHFYDRMLEQNTSNWPSRAICEFLRNELQSSRRQFSDLHPKVVILRRFLHLAEKSSLPRKSVLHTTRSDQVLTPLKSVARTPSQSPPPPSCSAPEKNTANSQSPPQAPPHLYSSSSVRMVFDASVAARAQEFVPSRSAARPETDIWQDARNGNDVGLCNWLDPNKFRHPVDQLDDIGVTPLQYAAANNAIDVPALLLSRGASYRHKNMYATWRLQQQLGCFHQLGPQAALPRWGEEGVGESGGRAMGGIMQGMQVEQWRP